MAISTVRAAQARPFPHEAAQAGQRRSPLVSPGGPSPEIGRARSRSTAAPHVPPFAHAAPSGNGAPPKPPPAAASAGADDPRDDDAGLERLRLALRMAAEGRTRPTIAAHFGVSDRTIRAWLAKARELRLGTFRSLSAEDALAEAEESLRALEAVAWDGLRAATAASYGRQAALWAREIADLIDRRLALHARIGAFEHLRQDRQAEREQRQGAGMGMIHMGTFDRRADDQAMEANGTTSVHDIEFDRVLRVQGIDPEEFNRAARDGLFREMLSNFSE